MSVHRLAKYQQDDPFVRVPNVTVNDQRVGLKSLGLLVFMLSKPDGWRFRERALASQLAVSRQQIRTAMATLIELGYVERHTVVEDGVPVVETRVFDIPRTGQQELDLGAGTPSVPPRSASTTVANNDRREGGPLSNNGLEVTTDSKQRDLLFEAVVDVCGQKMDRMTKSERGRINAALKQLRDVGATPEQVRGAARRYSKVYPSAPITATALAANWTKVAPEIRSTLDDVELVCPYCLNAADEHDDIFCASIRNRYGD